MFAELTSNVAIIFSNMASKLQALLVVNPLMIPLKIILPVFSCMFWQRGSQGIVYLGLEEVTLF